MSDWYRLDNAAKVFPPVSHERNSSVYRLAVVLRDPVDPALLQKATDHVYDRFPMLFLRLRSGVFWNYLDENRQTFLVQEEHSYPCAYFDPKENNGYLLKIFYYHSRVSLEVYHSLTDGQGAFELLKSILYYYFTFAGHSIDPQGKILLAEEGASYYEAEDSFAGYYEDVPAERRPVPDAYRIRGTAFEPYGHNVTTGVVDAAQLAALARAQGATITSYLAAQLIYSIYEVRLRYRSNNHKPVVAAVPVSLRGAFPSKTLRNFFCLVNLEYLPATDTSFEEILASATSQLKEKTQKDNLQRILSNNARFERNVGARFAPLFLKRLGIKFGFNFFGETKKTFTFSNLGRIELPDGMLSLVKYFEVNLYPTKKSPVNVSACSVGGRMTICFSRSIREADIGQAFFSNLAAQGLQVNLYTNHWGVGDAQV